jgi:hypothetical protein
MCTLLALKNYDDRMFFCYCGMFYVHTVSSKTPAVADVTDAVRKHIQETDTILSDVVSTDCNKPMTKCFRTLHVQQRSSFCPYTHLCGQQTLYHVSLETQSSLQV